MPDLVSLNSDQFMAKYDQGPLDSGGCGCSEWGVDANDGLIEAIEVSSFAEMKEDFKKLTSEDQTVVAKKFSPETAHFLAREIDSNYSDFQEVFDNGDGIGASGNDYFYDLSEVKEDGGGLLAFRRKFDSLNPLVQGLLNPHIHQDLSNQMDRSLTHMFWETYDNGSGSGARSGDGIIDSKEVVAIKGGWKNFVDDLLYIAKHEGKKKVHDIFDSMRSLPPDGRIMDRLRSEFPEYTDRYNFYQFPKVSRGTFKSVRLAFSTIRSLNEGRIPSEFALSTLKEFPHMITLTKEERFYAGFLKHLKEHPSEKIDVYTLARLYDSAEMGRPMVSVELLKKALEDNPRRYADVIFAVSGGYPIKRFELDEKDTGEYEILELESRDEDDRKLRDKLKAKDVPYRHSRESNSELVDGKWVDRPYTKYEFKLPIVEVNYRGAICSSDDKVCMPILYGRKYVKYSNLSFDDLRVYKFDGEGFRRRETGAKQVFVRPVRSLDDPNVWDLVFSNFKYNESDYLYYDTE